MLKGDPMKVLRSSNENNPLIDLAVNENIMSLYESGYTLDVNVLDILAGLSCPKKPRHIDARDSCPILSARP